MTDLDDRLHAAHAAQDRSALVRLYTEAADRAETRQAMAFYLTHAYVHALEAGLPTAGHLRRRLAVLGCETP
ncbi:hypothetical protein SAMN05444007_101316 [Cribrihabitans marinus]|uniref:Uncharacterized protein n=1 Tax=Cribrihabitans marinus TaxID=1227549 RepID=A0A1H6R9E1_9RHOB|nr:hypothetical protein [Cribrihabitans marinus]GGH19971.1 hypothetical protein GCM10010973_03620 [Cribrihabitans marinus]SEI47802.1 hypothetical protein SAMN05444007_101316 [Cribrihabitans marinus]